jgi:hypothetical protein
MNALHFLRDLVSYGLISEEEFLLRKDDIESMSHIQPITKLYNASNDVDAASSDREKEQLVTRIRNLRIENQALVLLFLQNQSVNMKQQDQQYSCDLSELGNETCVELRQLITKLEQNEKPPIIVSNTIPAPDNKQRGKKRKRLDDSNNELQAKHTRTESNSSPYDHTFYEHLIGSNLLYHCSYNNSTEPY